MGGGATAGDGHAGSAQPKVPRASQVHRVPRSWPRGASQVGAGGQSSAQRPAMHRAVHSASALHATPQPPQSVVVVMVRSQPSSRRRLQSAKPGWQAVRAQIPWRQAAVALGMAHIVPSGASAKRQEPVVGWQAPGSLQGAAGGQGTARQRQASPTPLPTESC